MTDFDLDREITRALRDSPDDASPDFTRQVMRRLDETPSRSAPWLRPALAGGALLAAALTMGVLLDRGDNAPTLAAPATVSAERHVTDADPKAKLRREYLALQEELAQIRQLADEQAPILYLGGDESFDLVYDLTDHRAARPGAVRPASLPDRG